MLEKRTVCVKQEPKESKFHFSVRALKIWDATCIRGVELMHFKFSWRFLTVESYAVLVLLVSLTPEIGKKNFKRRTHYKYKYTDFLALMERLICQKLDVSEETCIYLQIDYVLTPWQERFQSRH